MTPIILFTLAILFFLIANLILSGSDLSQYDHPTGEHFDNHPDDKPATDAFLKVLHTLHKDLVNSKSIKNKLKIARTFADNLSADLKTDTVFTPVNGIDAEWAITPGANTRKRILFLHGGAFIFGSPRGHRKFCDKLTKITNGVVLSVNYRMLLENNRNAGIEDAQQAYQWILANGPEGSEALNFLMVCGDSAGGSLALMLSNWSKTNTQRKPDAVIAFSPSTDMTFSSPTLKSNQHTDKMLGESLGKLAKLPKPVGAWLTFILMRANPANRLVSPLFDDLSDLPPTLIQASSNEMLLGEAIRFTNKARISGSNVKLQIWKDQIHDWQMVNMGAGSAEVAWAEVEKFLAPLSQTSATLIAAND